MISPMLKIVSNTTPIISLLKLSRLDILQKLYGEILIPKAVFDEIEAGRDKNYYQDLSKIDWIKITNIKDTRSVKYFMDLDTGEAEAIVLATEINADLIILDEKLGRFHAKHADLKVTGTIGVLIKAKSQGLVKEIRPLLVDLTKKDVWLSDRLIQDILKQVGE
jgi:predicted nucleic acid-binding protein